MKGKLKKKNKVNQVQILTIGVLKRRKIFNLWLLNLGLER